MNVFKNTLTLTECIGSRRKLAPSPTRSHLPQRGEGTYPLCASASLILTVIRASRLSTRSIARVSSVTWRSPRQSRSVLVHTATSGIRSRSGGEQWVDGIYFYTILYTYTSIAFFSLPVQCHQVGTLTTTRRVVVHAPNS